MRARRGVPRTHAATPSNLSLLVAQRPCVQLFPRNFVEEYACRDCRLLRLERLHPHISPGEANVETAAAAIILDHEIAAIEL